MMEKIYILKKKKLMYGPYSMELIQKKGLNKDDLIWHDGLLDWKPVTEIEELTPFIDLAATQSKQKKSIIERLFGFLN